MDMLREDTLDAFSSESTTLTVEPCSICGRKFNPDSLVKHERICVKTSQKTRKVFNSSKQRAEGTEISTNTSSYKEAVGVKAPAPSLAKKNNWRQKHEEFVSAIRNARQVQKAIDSGGPLPPPPPPTINPDYVQCPYCQRRFNANAADRHMPFCKEQHERLPKNKPSAQATAKWNSMKQYKAPKLKSRGGGVSGGLSSPPSSGYGTSNTSTPASGYGGGSSYSSASPARSQQQRNAAPRATRSSGGGMATSRQSGFGGEDQSAQGQALRTGRTAQGYSEARQLSAKQRAAHMNSKPNAYTSSSMPPSSPYSTPTSSMVNGFGGSPDLKTNRVASGAAKFCHECGTKYPVPHAKFCCECGIKRVNVA